METEGYVVEDIGHIVGVKVENVSYVQKYADYMEGIWMNTQATWE